jgi:hypothetical protein
VTRMSQISVLMPKQKSGIIKYIMFFPVVCSPSFFHSLFKKFCESVEWYVDDDWKESGTKLSWPHFSYSHCIYFDELRNITKHSIMEVYLSGS